MAQRIPGEGGNDGHSGDTARELSGNIEHRIPGRDFAEADRLRTELVALNVTLKDSRGGTTWTIAQ